MYSTALHGPMRPYGYQPVIRAKTASGDIVPLEHREMTADGALEDRYGLVVGGRDLARLLGFRSSQAFKIACARGKVPVVVFEIPGRRGKYARTSDVIRWYEALPGAIGTESSTKRQNS